MGIGRFPDCLAIEPHMLRLRLRVRVADGTGFLNEVDCLATLSFRQDGFLYLLPYGFLEKVCPQKP